jgi:hypothetical protein
MLKIPHPSGDTDAYFTQQGGIAYNPRFIWFSNSITMLHLSISFKISSLNLLAYMFK